MQKSRGSIQLSSYDDIFGGAPDSAKETADEQGKEHVKDIPLSELHPFKNHPFKVLDDEEMCSAIDNMNWHLFFIGSSSLKPTSKFISIGLIN